MNFYAHQEDARRRTRTLVGLMILAVLGVVLAINTLGALGWRLIGIGEALPPYFYATNTVVILLYIGGGAWLEWQRLKAGGAAVMLRLGARAPDPYSARERQFVNVSEEMAISSGLPVPDLFVLDHESINAMAAGHDPADSAILVTRGALEHLNRDELQGVVAHEFAHLVHGDAALNTRMAGALYGLVVLHMLGKGLLRLGAGGVSRHGRPSLLFLPWVVGMGALLWAVGCVGAFAARLVQAGVSRQCEFQADASAVQFTRDRDGIGRALRKIAGHQASPLATEYADVVAHFWLASEQPGGWLDTHPSLITRIRRVYGRPLPAIVPKFVEISDASEQAGKVNNDLVFEPGMSFVGRRHGTMPEDDAAIGEPSFELQSTALAREARDSAAAMVGAPGLADTPAAILIAAARDPQPRLSRAALLLNTMVAGPSALGEDEHTSDTVLHDAVMWLETPDAHWLRVPLIEILTARLRHWPLEARNTLVRYCHDAVLADGRVEKIEWIYFTLVRHRLLPEQCQQSGMIQPSEKSAALANLFAMAEELSGSSARARHDALVSAASAVGIARPAFTPETFELRSLDEGLDALRSLPALRKPALLRALDSLAREPVSPAYKAFMIAVAGAIDCPPMRISARQKGAGQPSSEHTAA